METDGWHLEAGLGPDPAGVTSVLVLRPGGLGAVVRAVPALRHLRDTYRDSVLTVAADAPAMELLDACPFVDRAIDLAHAQELRLERFDVAISFAPLPGDEGDDDPGRRALLDLSAIAHRAGAAWRSADAPSTKRVHPMWPERLSDSARMLRLAWLLGGQAPNPSLGLWPTLADRNGAARLMGGVDMPIVLVHVGAGLRERRWHEAGWSRVLDLLVHLGLEPVLIGAPTDVDASARVAGLARIEPRSVVGATSVGELAGLIERATLVIGGDSGPVALASALGVRSVIVGPASTIEHGCIAGRVDVVLAGPCLECGELSCGHTLPPASLVPEEQVLAQVAIAGESAVRRWAAEHVV